MPSSYNVGGTLIVLRLLQKLVLAILLLGQTHVCLASYRLPDGRGCVTCPTLKDFATADRQDLTPTVSSSHGDCHDCCTLQASDDHGDSLKAALQGGFSTVFDTSPPVVLVKTRPGVVLEIRIAALIDAAPTNGPPGIPSSRAPPTATFPSPSAGCEIVNLA